MRIRLAVTIAATLSMACGGSSGSKSVDAAADVAAESASSGEGGVEAGADVEFNFDDAASDASPDVSLPTPAPCPATPPEAGTPCQPPGYCNTGCEYGDDPRPSYNLIMGCTSKGWVVSQTPVLTPDAGAPADAGCPATYAEAMTGTTSCTPKASCSYPEGTCVCGTYVTDLDASTALSCSPAPLAPGCPATLAEAMAATTCPGTPCLYPGGGCGCETTDAGERYYCELPAPGCPAERPRLGAACDADASWPSVCTYNLECVVPMTGQLRCCKGTWIGLPGPLCGP
jgi:hypothetical protein